MPLWSGLAIAAHVHLQTCQLPRLPSRPAGLASRELLNAVLPRQPYPCHETPSRVYFDVGNGSQNAPDASTSTAAQHLSPTEPSQPKPSSTKSTTLPKAPIQLSQCHDRCLNAKRTGRSGRGLQAPTPHTGHPSSFQHVDSRPISSAQPLLYRGHDRQPHDST